MPLEPQRLLNLEIPRRPVGYADRDVMLYALSVGFGAGEGDLDFVYERDLTVVPSFATALAFDDSWLERAGVDLRRVVHGSLDLRFAKAFEPAGEADVSIRIVGLSDKGEGKGGLIHQETILEQRGAPVCTALSTLFVRGAGGFGGSVGREAPSEAAPDRPADATVRIPTEAKQALLFRLLGDRNPLHADPDVARAAGFDRPILHGACTFGIACATALTHFCDRDPQRLTRLAARFAGPLYPGETLAFSFWKDIGRAAFKAFAVGRDAIVLDNGLVEFRSA